MAAAAMFSLCANVARAADLAPERPVAITVWAMGREGQLIRVLADRFESENPGIKIVTEQIPWEAAHEKLLTATAADMGPDVTQMGTTWMPEFQRMDVLEPLDAYAGRSKDTALGAFFPGSRTSTLFNGRRYGIPWYVDTRAIYYRRDLAAEAGYSEFPKTWERFHDLCVKLVRRNSRPGMPAYAFTLPITDWQFFLMFFWQNGGDILPDGPSGEVFAPDGLEGALSFMKSFFDEKLAPMESDRSNNSVNLFNLFESGYLPIFLQGSSAISEIRQHKPELLKKLGTATLPAAKASVSFVGGSNLVLFRTSAHKPEAWRFIEFLSRPDVQAFWYKTSNDLPSVRRAWKDPALSSDPLMEPFKAALQNAKSPPAVLAWEQIADVLARGMEQVMFGRLPVSEARRTLTAEIRPLLQEPVSRQSVAFRVAVTALIFALPLILLLAYFKGACSGKSRHEHAGAAFWFLLPSLTLLGVFLFIPIVASFAASLTNWNIYGLNDLGRVSYVGFENYARLFRDPVFRVSLRNTFVFAFVGVPLSVALSLGMALALNRRFLRWKPFFRIAYFIPFITTMVAVATIWRWLYNPVYGFFNIVLARAGLGPQQWLTDPRLALACLILMALWKGFGYSTIIFVAGLQSIPATLYESVQIDGAGPWQQFRYVTVPMLRRTMFFVVVISTIGYLQFFAEPYVMTYGGPVNATMSVVFEMYLQGFKFYNLGYASAIAYVLSVIVFVLALAERRIEGGAEGAAH